MGNKNKWLTISVTSLIRLENVKRLEFHSGYSTPNGEARETTWFQLREEKDILRAFEEIIEHLACGCQIRYSISIEIYMYHERISRLNEVVNSL